MPMFIMYGGDYYYPFRIAVLVCRGISACCSKNIGPNFLLKVLREESDGCNNKAHYMRLPDELGLIWPFKST
jgi:hypothetical protein